MTQYFKVGKLVNTQGLRGEVRVISSTDFIEERYRKGAKLTLTHDQFSPVELIVRSHRKHKNFDLLCFEGYDRIEQVEPFKNGILHVALEDLQDLDEHEYYYHEIIGLTVQTEEGKELGKISEILSPGANDVWLVHSKDKKELLIPYIEPVVKDINLEKKVVTIHVIEGLIDED